MTWQESDDVRSFETFSAHIAHVATEGVHMIRQGIPVAFFPHGVKPIVRLVETGKVE